MKINKNVLYGLLLCLVALIPIALAHFMHKPIFSTALGDANGWLGFWGGYIGAIVGALTVYLVTSKQLEAQRELHNETLVTQTKLHETNMIEQRKLQMESIHESAKLNDLRQRELIISNMRIDKIEMIVQDLISLNIINFERFNIIRTYNQYNSRIKEIEKILREEKKKRSVANSLKNRTIKIEYSLKINKRKFARLFKKYDFKMLLETRSKYLGTKDDLLEKETNKRNEIRKISAKMKSDAMFAGLDDTLDTFRGYQNEVLNKFYNEIVKNEINENDMYSLLDFHIDEFMTLSNEAIQICKRRLNAEISTFIKGN
ncbi:TPA: hypothetical protein JLW60_004688 [Escherichia coli]|uniref:hypothetical protein n=1 Tax=Bacillus sp. HNG TaxID=2293325 RepID=UPI000E2E790A|nr:hypothetical protein [Bacillus sp. HNG]RFB11481.1 hypothetical protein DZB84_20680 [Bacillus sp. HNG]HAW4413306.1 hypothetical protein [Escherichia coli]